MYYIGVDVGGTNIATGVINEDGKLIKKVSVKANGQRPPEEITKDVYNFLLDNFDYLNSFNEIIIYYDNGQNLITKILNGAFAISGLNYEFKKEVVPGSYRLFQVADFVSTVKLLEIKLSKSELSNSELKFVDVYHLKKNYIKGVNKKTLKR